MAVISVFLGHWRALEDRWLAEFSILKNHNNIAVITAGQPVANRLMGLVPNSTAGVQFLPGFPALSKVLAGSVTGKPVPEPQLTAIASQTGYRPESARTAAVFFEKLIELGVSADSFSVITHSTKGLHSEVLKTSERFTAYSSVRNRIHPRSPDRVYAEGPKKSTLFSTYMFYGFYDLNPAQRKYVKELSKVADVVWFSPVHPSHHWRETSGRTLNFLKNLGIGTLYRVDAKRPLSSLAQFAENLLTDRTPGRANVELLKCSSGMGFTKAVVNKVSKLMSSYTTGEIAVISTGEDARRITAMLYTEGIPCASAFSVKASDLPAGRFLERLLNLGENSFHHKDIEKLLLTGVITLAQTPDAGEYAKNAAARGARFGLDSLRATGFPFALVLADFFLKLPAEAGPDVYLSKVANLMTELCGDSLPSVFFDSLLLPEVFGLNQQVEFDVFREMVHVALDVSVKLNEPEPRGVAVLSPERARGILKKALVVTGMEEGVFPRTVVNDPRLPVEVKKQLQFPPPDLRETEEAFLLRQVFEAAEETASVIWRNVDSSGRPVALSPFLAPLLKKDSSVSIVQLTNSPLKVLSIPENPPFLLSSAKSQLERVRFNPKDPSPLAEHCGMIKPGIHVVEEISASLLESYARYPFSVLQNKIWDVHEAVEFPVRSEPEPALRGKIVHNCIETVLENGQPPEVVVETVCREKNLTALLGSETLAEIWMKHLVQGIDKFTSKLEEFNWSFVCSEKYLRGTVAGFPANGRIDLILKNAEGRYLLVDIKTGAPKVLKNSKGISIIKNGLFQLPFYRDLAIQNGYSPLSEAAYIYLQGDGNLEVKSLTEEELEGVHNEFVEKVQEIVTAMNTGNFHTDSETERQFQKNDF